MQPSRIALGCVTFGREIDEDASFRILDYAFENGIRLFDTAEVYGSGASERILGNWLRRSGVRSDVIVQTKASVRFTKEGIRTSIAGSLDRLQVDVIDSYLLHRLDSTVLVVECVDEISRAPVRSIGCSNVSAPRLREAIAELRSANLPLFESVQPPYNLLQREIEGDFMPFCVQSGIQVVPYSPLAAGFLTNKYSPDRSAVPADSRFGTIPGHLDVYFSDRNFRIVSRLHEFASEVGVPPLQLAFAWVLRNEAISAVLTGARSTAHIDNAFAAAKLEIPDEWAAKMNSWSSED